MNKKFSFQVLMDTKSIEKKADGSLKIKGYASTKDLDRYNDVVEPKAFDGTVDVFMKAPVMLLQHDADKPIGRFEELTVDSKGLEVVGNVLYNENDCMKKIEDGVLGAFSIGYIPKKWEIHDEDGKLVATERGYEPGCSWEDVWYGNTTRTIKELDLIEISVVSTPANPHAVFSLEKSVKSFFDEEAKKWKELLDSKEKKETPETADDTPQEVIADVAQEALNTEGSETGGETPQVSEEAPVVEALNAETGSETPAPEVPEEKSIQVERKSFEGLEAKVAGLESELKTAKEFNLKLVEVIEALNGEMKGIREAVASIPMKKGIATIVGGTLGKEEQKSTGYIDSLIQSAKNH